MGQKTNPKGIRIPFLQQNFFFQTKRFNAFKTRLSLPLFETNLLPNKTAFGDKFPRFFLIRQLCTFYFSKFSCLINELFVFENSINLIVFVEFFMIKESTLSSQKFIYTLQKHLEAVVLIKKPIKFFFLRINDFLDITEDITSFLKKKTVKNFVGITSLFSLGFVCNFFPAAVVFSRIVSLALEKNIKHLIVLEIVNQLFDFLFQLKTTSFKGLKLQVSGRINGVDIAKKQTICYGSVPLQSITTFVNYGYSVASTPYGACGVKVWFSYNKKLFILQNV
jgi:hypothetical protein